MRRYGGRLPGAILRYRRTSGRPSLPLDHGWQPSSSTRVTSPFLSGAVQHFRFSSIGGAVGRTVHVVRFLSSATPHPCGRAHDCEVSPPLSPADATGIVASSDRGVADLMK